MISKEETKQVYELTDLDVKAVAFVPKGANNRTFLLVKCDGSCIDLEDLDTRDLIQKGILSEAKGKIVDTLRGVWRLISPVKDEISKIHPDFDKEFTTNIKDIFDRLGIGDLSSGFPAPEAELGKSNEITKRGENMELDESIAKILNEPIEDEDQIIAQLTKAGLSPEATAAAVKALKMMMAFKDELKDPIKTLQSIMPQSYGYPAPAGKEEPTKKEEPEVKKEGPQVAMSPEVAALFKEHEVLKKANEEQAEKIAKMENERITKEFIEKAAQYSHIPTTAEKLGPLFKAVSEKMPDEFQEVEALFKQMDEMLVENELLKEMGSSRAGMGNAYDKLKAIADGKVQKDGKLTFAKAFSKASLENPDLTMQYQQEQRAKS